MPRQVALRPRAIADIEDIWAYTVETWSREQAESYLAGLDVAMFTLSEFPEMARLRPEFEPPVRIHPYRAHLIVYRFSDVAIDVIRILPARSDWAAVLID